MVSALFPKFEALIGTSAPGPLQKSQSEKTYTLAVSMLPIGFSNNR